MGKAGRHAPHPLTPSITTHTKNRDEREKYCLSRAGRASNKYYSVWTRRWQCCYWHSVVATIIVSGGLIATVRDYTSITVIGGVITSAYDAAR